MQNNKLKSSKTTTEPPRVKRAYTKRAKPDTNTNISDVGDSPQPSLDIANKMLQFLS